MTETKLAKDIVPGDMVELEAGGIMNLTDDIKSQIDAMPYEKLYAQYTYSSSTDPLYHEGETCEYIENRLKELSEKDDA